MLVKEDLEARDLQLEESAKLQADAELAFLEAIRDAKRQAELQQDATRALEEKNSSLEREVCWA